MEIKTGVVVALVTIIIALAVNSAFALFCLAILFVGKYFWDKYEVVVIKENSKIHLEYTENGRRERLTIDF